MLLKCRICENDAKNRVHHANEMMFGTRESFEYFECNACGTIQITEVPDLGTHYPEQYYSFSDAGPPEYAAVLTRKLTPAFYGLSKWTSSVLPSAASLLKQLDLESQLFDKGLGLSAVLASGVSKSSCILDVGCGAGRLLHALAGLGFKSLTGIDVFLKNETATGAAVRLLKTELKELDGTYDLIMFHHSLEHVPDPAAALRTARERLTNAGLCLVRIPVVNYAWEKYGVNWVGLDAPRHLHLFTEEGFCRLAESSGFHVEQIVYDSTSFQFVGSEQYSRNISLTANASARSIFSRKQIGEWKREARRLNDEGRGDQAAFYLRPR